MANRAASKSIVPSVEFDASLIRKFDRAGPRYTSYPTADRFSETFSYGDYLQAVAGLNARKGRPALSLYFHIPFCDTVCYYCGCNKVVTRDRSKAVTYLGYLKREIEMQGKLFAGMNQVQQLHIGGGTPTYLTDAQLTDLMAHVRRWFQLAPDASGEYSIELDPRTVSDERIHALRNLGFNRVSLGVQDLNLDVQKAVNRIQSEQQTVTVMNAAREACFRSISIDLIYGLPRQTVITMEQTLSEVIAADPDRIAIYNYAHLPHIFKPQRRISEADMPGSEAKLDMLYLCVKRLTRVGYVYIGMDHFTKPTDGLAVAQRQGRLHRNFQGYSTHAESDLVACGVSAISAVGATYSQNAKTLDEYYDLIAQGELPIKRGLKLSMDDLLRHVIIQMLMCNVELSISAIETAYPIDFKDYFRRELEQLQVFEQNGLVTIEADWITVTLKGRLLVRNICMVFDRYLSQAPLDASHTSRRPLRYSRTI